MNAFQKQKLVDIEASDSVAGREAPLTLPSVLWRGVPRRSSENIQGWRLLAIVFLPFAAGYYLSYLFRTINALISGALTTDLGLGAGDLGFLTSVYFLTFAAAQVPIGVLLDRHGPRRIQSVLLLVAAAGAALFAIADGFIPLVVARAMIGLGVAAALTAGLKAIVLWFPRERLALINGCMVMVGALGAVTATAPVEMLLASTGWRGLFAWLAVATALAAVAVYVLVPEHRSALPSRMGPTCARLKAVYTDPRFHKLAPLSATCVGSAWALQGLWAAPWLADVEGLDRAGLVTHLFVMAAALSFGALLLGAMADRMRRHGIGPQHVLAGLAILSIAAQLALILRLPVPSLSPWLVIAVAGAGTVLSYAIVAECFPKEAAGRANGALNACHLGWAFVFQCATGLVLDQWPSQDGHYPSIAYQVAFGVNVALQAVALVWFELDRLKRFASNLAHCVSGRSGEAVRPCTPYQRAAWLWASRVDSARVQLRTWRLAALGSTTLSLVLGLALAITASRAGVAPHIIEVAHLSQPRGPSTATEPKAPSDAQIAYFLTRFVKNVRSLSIDPVVVRANWMEALNYATDGGAQALTDYVRETKPFTNLGLRAVAVELVYLIRASDNLFEVRWKEETYENGAAVKAEMFTGLAEIILTPIMETMKNPLGLYVHSFRWSHDVAQEER